MAIKNMQIETSVQMQQQIDLINRKLDLILEEVYTQKQNREAVNDLVDDLSIIGKDVFKNTVIQLDKAGVELDSNALAEIGIKLVRNLNNINDFLDMMESINDFLRDATPILRQTGLDAINKMNELDRKGYIDFFREFARVVDNIISGFSTEDVRTLADNIVTILQTVKDITQPDMLQAMNNAVLVYKNLDTQNVQEYTLWKAFRELRTPEMKKGMGFMITFLKNLAKETDNHSK
ncbi:MAG: DUF1641 domain-containing protein [Bacteroidales bacterium]|nr:DUF1641 domain-containing protein [Bacteroidales bacterium]